MRIDSLYLKDIGPFEEVTIDFPAGTNPDLADVYLLTGENGCGKSTVLYAIASLLRAPTNPVQERMRSPNAMARLFSGGRETVAVPGSTEGALSAPQKNTRPQRWAAFAYAGTRSLTSGRIRELRELEVDALENCLSFHGTANSEHLALWLAGQNYKRFTAKEAGDLSEAERLQRTMRDIERAIADIVDDPTFAFVTRSGLLGTFVRHRNADVDFDLLPDGVKSIVSWVADLLMRMDRIPWVDDVPLTKRSFLLLLDEIDIYLHPAWQRRILPMVAKLLPNAQIIASTHSPFVVASAEQDAHIIRFDVKGGRSTLDPTKRGAQAGTSVSAVLADIFGIKTEFDIDTEKALKAFDSERVRLLRGEAADRSEVDRLAHQLAARSEELADIMGMEMRQLERQLKKPVAS